MYNISKGTIIRSVTLIIVLINLVLEKFGLDLINTEGNHIACAVETLIEIGSIIASWWYNNSYSKNALKADRFFKALKEIDQKEN